MNIRRLKSLLWFTVVLALALAGYTFWDIFQGKKAQRYEAKDPQYFEDLLFSEHDDRRTYQMGPTSYAEADYEQIWLARVDGSVPPRPEEELQRNQQRKEPEKPKAPPIDSVLEVGMLVWSVDPLNRLVAVEYVQDAPGLPADVSKLRRLHLTEGEPLKSPYDREPYNGRVVRIDPQEVVFHWGEGEVTVSPGLDSAGDGMPVDRVTFATTVDLSAEFDSWPEQTTRRDDGSFVVGSQDLEQFAGGGEALQQQLRARSITPTGGGRSFLELTEVEPGSMPSRFGFQTGDRILSVNGHPMSSMAEAIAWGKAHPNEPQYTVVWERAGKQQTTIVHAPSS